MANIRKVEGKTGTAYKITVFSGTDAEGRQVRHYRTWKPEPGMTARQIEKAVQRAAVDFERELELGYQADNRQTFAQYAEYVMKLKERAGLKPKTLFEYRAQLVRINAAIGHMKLQDIRPQHLNSFYKNLAEEGVRQSGYRATATADLGGLLKEKKMTTIMVTHNLRYAVEYGNRLIMMHEGKAILDKAGEEKKSINTEEIMGIFNKISVECGN